MNLRKNQIVAVLLILLCSGSLAAHLEAQTSFPMLGSVFPAGVQRGKTTEVTVLAGGNGGANLNGAYKAIFEGNGVTAEIVPPEKGWPAKDPKTPWALPGVGEVKMRVTVAPDAALGVREFRVATARMGISSLAQLVIGDEPEVVEAEPNNDIEKAQAIPVPCVVSGRFQQGEDVDLYKFKADAGQEVVFSVNCARLQDKIHDLQEHADPMIVLRDTRGVELIRNDDYFRADSLLHYKFEKAGEYVIQIRDVGYKGNGHWVYCLNVTSRPFVTAVVPCAVRAGQTASLHLYGFNLGSADRVTVSVPPDVPQGVWKTPLTLPNGLSNPVPLLVTEGTQTESVPGFAQNAPAGKEQKEGHAALTATGSKAGAAARPLALPGGVNAWLAKEGQIDRYTFTARKGAAWGFEVTSRRLDSEIDSELKLRNAKGDVLAANDDAYGKDSRIDWTAPEDGQYTIEVRDLAGHAGPTYFYNLTARPLRPDFLLKCDTDRAMIAPGNRTTWYVLAERKYGFGGEIKAEVKGLPAGVTASPLTIPANMTTGTIFLTAASDAKIDVARAEVIGTGLLPGADGKPAPVSRTAHPLTEIYMPGGGRGLLEVLTQGIAVTEQNDLEVTANMQQINLMPGGTVKIEIELKRRPDYTKPVTLDVRVQHLGGIFVNPLPPGVTVDDGASKTLLGDNETKGYLTLKAAPDAQPIKDLPLAVFANVSLNFVMKAWYAAAPISLTVSVPEKK